MRGVLKIVLKHHHCPVPLFQDLPQGHPLGSSQRYHQGGPEIESELSQGQVFGGPSAHYRAEAILSPVCSGKKLQTLLAATGVVSSHFTPPKCFCF